MKNRRNWLVGSLMAAFVAFLLASVVWYSRENRQRSMDYALIQSIKNRDTSSAFLLLRSGADANANDRANVPASFGTVLADYWNSLRRIKFALDNDADPVGLSHDNGRSALMLAVYQSDSKLVGELLRRGANANAQGRDGVFALWIATERGDLATSTGAEVKIVRQLLEHNARVDLRDKHGESVFGLVSEMERPDPEIVHLLKQARYH